MKKQQINKPAKHISLSELLKKAIEKGPINPISKSLSPNASRNISKEK